MPNLQSETIVLGSDGFTSAASPAHRLGTRAVDRGGRVYRYARAGAADLVAGTLLQAAAPVPNHLANTPPVVAIGATSFTYTPGATLGTAGQYEAGWLQVDTTPGNGYMYRIARHLAFASATAFTLELESDDPIQVALTASSRVGLIAHPLSAVIICPTTKTGAVVGVATYIITALQYGWILTWGPAPVLINGTPAVTAPVVNSATTAGAVDVWTAAAQPTATYVGEMLQVGVSTKNNAVYVKIYA